MAKLRSLAGPYGVLQNQSPLPSQASGQSYRGATLILPRKNRVVWPTCSARHRSTRACWRYWHSPGTYHNLDSRRAGTRRQNSDTRQESSSNPRQASHFRKTQSTAAPAVARYRVQEYKTRSAFQKAGYRKFLRRLPGTPGRSSDRKTGGDKSSSAA